jgi:hypothetical protein
MSDERDYKSNKTSNDEVKTEDVEAHVKSTKNAAIDGPDEVKGANVNSGRNLSGDDGESDDDVTAHVKSNKT